MISRRRRASPVPIKVCMSQVDESACGRKPIQNGKASSWDVARCNFASFSAVNCLTRISGWLPAQTKNCWSPKTKLHKRSFLTQSRFSHIHLKEQRIRLSVSEGQRSSSYSALKPLVQSCTSLHSLDERVSHWYSTFNPCINFRENNRFHILFWDKYSGCPEFKKSPLKVDEVTETKAFMRKSGSSVCRGWQTLRPDWPVPARMGFAVNRSQLVQSEWKETAQKGHFVPLFVKLEAKTKHNRQLFSPSLLESMGAN